MDCCRAGLRVKNGTVKLSVCRAFRQNFEERETERKRHRHRETERDRERERKQLQRQSRTCTTVKYRNSDVAGHLGFVLL